MAVRQGKRAAAPASAATEPGTAAVAPAPKSRGLTVPALVVAVAVLGAAFLLRPSGAAPATAQAAAAEATPEEEVAPGPVVNLEPITMNLHGGGHLKVGIALQLSAEAVEGGHGAEAVENSAAFGARALDVAIQVLGAHSRDELSAAGGVDGAKAKLTEKVAEEYHDEVLEVYFTQFVIA